MRRESYLVIFLLTVMAAQHPGPHSDYYRDEDAFRKGIKLFPFEVHEESYLKIDHDESSRVIKMSWYTRLDSLLKFRILDYWADDGSLKRLLEMSADSLILRELLFGDEKKSREFIEYLFGVDVAMDFRDRFTEVFYDSTRRVTSFRITSIQGDLLGAIFLDYDSLGYLVNETWFKGEEMDRVREFRYIFHKATREQEVIERGKEGQVISHVRIKTDPHWVPSSYLDIGVEPDSSLPPKGELPPFEEKTGTMIEPPPVKPDSSRQF